MFKNASRPVYLGLLNYESRLVQEIEIHERIRGHENEVKALREDKQRVSVIRKRMKLVLDNKRQLVRPTLTAKTE